MRLLRHGNAHDVPPSNGEADQKVSDHIEENDLNFVESDMINDEIMVESFTFPLLSYDERIVPDFLCFFLKKSCSSTSLRQPVVQPRNLLDGQVQGRQKKRPIFPHTVRVLRLNQVGAILCVSFY